MRHSKTEKENTHKRIVTVAAKKFREEGLTGIGIADLMRPDERSRSYRGRLL